MALAKRKPAAKKTARGSTRVNTKTATAKRGRGRPPKAEAAPAKRGRGRPPRAAARQEKAARTPRKQQRAAPKAKATALQQSTSRLTMDTVIQVKVNEIEIHPHYVIVNGSQIIPRDALIAVLNEDLLIYRGQVNLGKLASISDLPKGASAEARSLGGKVYSTDKSTAVVFDDSSFHVLTAASQEDSGETEESDDTGEAEDEAEDLEDDTDDADDEAEEDDDDDAEDSDDDDDAEDEDDDAEDSDDDYEEPVRRKKSSRDEEAEDDDDDDDDDEF